ncbi:MAG: hypothetical protein K8T91_17770 [Planctomycetes bacterium]|nr:hypothetical protein [Planctomycetota bacterium]
MTTAGAERRYRVWIVTCEGWLPQSPSDVPPHAIALEPAEEWLMSAEEAGAYLEGFNQTVLEEQTGHWAVAVPIQVRYEGNIQEGKVVQCARYASTRS